MPRPKEIKIEFKVCYKAKAHYTGSWYRNLCAGVQGTFDNMAAAQDAEQSCKRWFQTELINVPKEIKGVMVDDVKSVIHDNVETWIEEWHDGDFYEPQAKQEEPKADEQKETKGKKAALVS